MRPILLCLLPCCLLAAAPSDAPRPPRPPPRVATLFDDGQALPDAAVMESLAQTDPSAFLRACLRRYDREVQGYRLVMLKRERIAGTLHPMERIQVAFRERPFSAYLHWEEGARRAERALYIEGENGGKMLARPASRILRLAGEVVARDVDGDDARQSGRYPLSQFGIKNGMLRTLASWTEAQRQNALHVEYRGIELVKEAGDRPCHVFRRTRYAHPEADRVTDLTVCIDAENWLQVGSVLRGEGGNLIGEYYFRDVCLNPTFADGEFRREALRPR